MVDEAKAWVRRKRGTRTAAKHVSERQPCSRGVNEDAQVQRDHPHHQYHHYHLFIEGLVVRLDALVGWTGEQEGRRRAAVVLHALELIGGLRATRMGAEGRPRPRLLPCLPLPFLAGAARACCCSPPPLHGTLLYIQYIHYAQQHTFSQQHSSSSVRKSSPATHLRIAVLAVLLHPHQIIHMGPREEPWLASSSPRHPILPAF